MKRFKLTKLVGVYEDGAAYFIDSSGKSPGFELSSEELIDTTPSKALTLLDMKLNFAKFIKQKEIRQMLGGWKLSQSNGLYKLSTEDCKVKYWKLVSLRNRLPDFYHAGKFSMIFNPLAIASSVRVRAEFGHPHISGTSVCFGNELGYRLGEPGFMNIINLVKWAETYVDSNPYHYLNAYYDISIDGWATRKNVSIYAVLRDGEIYDFFFSSRDLETTLSRIVSHLDQGQLSSEYESILFSEYRVGDVFIAPYFQDLKAQTKIGLVIEGTSLRKKSVWLSKTQVAELYAVASNFSSDGFASWDEVYF